MTEARDALAVALGTALVGEPATEPDAVEFLTQRADAILAALPDGLVLARRQDAEDGAAREFSALVDEARANHVRWEHTAELLEECLRPLCIGAKVLLWPDPDAPRLSALASPRATTR